MNRTLIIALLILVACLALAFTLSGAHAAPINYQGALSLERPIPTSGPLPDRQCAAVGCGDLVVALGNCPVQMTGSFRASLYKYYPLAHEDMWSAGLVLPINESWRLFSRFERRFRIDDERVTVGIQTNFRGRF